MVLDIFLSEATIPHTSLFKAPRRQKKQFQLTLLYFSQLSLSPPDYMCNHLCFFFLFVSLRGIQTPHGGILVNTKKKSHI